MKLDIDLAAALTAWWRDVRGAGHVADREAIDGAGRSLEQNALHADDVTSLGPGGVFKDRIEADRVGSRGDNTAAVIEQFQTGIEIAGQLVAAVDAVHAMRQDGRDDALTGASA